MKYSYLQEVTRYIRSSYTLSTHGIIISILYPVVVDSTRYANIGILQTPHTVFLSEIS